MSYLIFFYLIILIIILLYLVWGLNNQLKEVQSITETNSILLDLNERNIKKLMLDVKGLLSEVEAKEDPLSGFENNRKGEELEPTPEPSDGRPLIEGKSDD